MTCISQSDDCRGIGSFEDDTFEKTKRDEGLLFRNRLISSSSLNLCSVLLNFWLAEEEGERSQMISTCGSPSSEILVWGGS